MNLTWVLGTPTGNEKARVLTVDLGGTNLRICDIILKGKDGEDEVVQEQYLLPDGLKKGDKNELWDYIADSLYNFIEDHGLAKDGDAKLNLGFTFSYPALQDYIDHAILQTWTKGFDIKGVEGNDVAGQMREAMEKRVG
jgi:hexokinase